MAEVLVHDSAVATWAEFKHMHLLPGFVGSGSSLERRQVRAFLSLRVQGEWKGLPIHPPQHSGPRHGRAPSVPASDGSRLANLFPGSLGNANTHACSNGQKNVERTHKV
ncbi:hypothetical protein PILCRDRAFT_819679 [Piloderma croceum F 1598]|uniref:Uncharacterized protein n=1 Tax=Piloderma croceum (strain F 1598) TaxID=765440 RepID=A0A0C3FVE5_PILCF|nr:hypothetical protein PILCRDRAFT_819679 [Piloderma croceum F 1598]